MSVLGIKSGDIDSENISIYGYFSIDILSFQSSSHREKEKKNIGRDTQLFMGVQKLM